MKIKYFIFSLLVLIFIGSAYADHRAVIARKNAVTCDDCSGDLKFSWHCEDLDVTNDSPCGCSDGDETGAVAGSASISGTQYYDGDESLCCPSNSDDVTFTVSSDDLVNDAEGKLAFRIYIDTFNNQDTVFKAAKDADNELSVKMQGDSSNIDFVFRYEYATTVVYATADSDRGEDAWMYVEIVWKEQAGNDMQIKVCDSDGTSNCTTQIEDNDFSACGNVTSARFGHGDVYMDKIEIYGTSGL